MILNDTFSIAMLVYWRVHVVIMEDTVHCVTNHLQLYHQVVVFTTWSLVPAILIHFCFNPNLSQSLDMSGHRLPQATLKSHG